MDKSGFAFLFQGNAAARVSAARGGASTPRGWVLRTNLDGFTSDVASAVVPTALPNLTSFNVDLSGGLHQDIAAVTIRLYGFGPSTGIGQFFDNIVLNGNVEAIPEPNALAALCVSMLTMVLRRPNTRKILARS